MSHKEYLEMPEAIIVSQIKKSYRIGLKVEKDETLLSSIINTLISPITNYKRLSKLSKIKQSESGADVFHALRDVSFNVQKGEVVGIIGHNGAGKSTLLKILSRITEPTEGRIVLNGRVSSLLEVGTGFNPELTGRENIYLNGTILGMTKKEIDVRLLDIIAFSGIEKFVDTPVKRYSSGMKVRLAFAVAAHLDPEILLIDEVLAVGDVAFQKKCLGKMRDVNESGRTILFVSHDMGAIQSLCTRCIVLKEGQVVFDGPTATAVSHYLSAFQDHSQNLALRQDRGGDKSILFTSIDIADSEGNLMDVVHTGQKIHITLNYKSEVSISEKRNLVFSIFISADTGAKLLQFTSRYSSIVPENTPVSGRITCCIDAFPLLPGKYSLSVVCKDNTKMLDYLEGAFELTVISGHFPGYLRLPNNNAGPFVTQHYWYNEPVRNINIK